MYLKIKPSIFGALGTFISIILMYHILRLNTQESHSIYLDSTEITNYTLLESLISTRSGANIPYNNNNIHNLTPTTSTRLIRPENRITNLNLQALNDLTSKISLNKNKQSVSVIIQYVEESDISLLSRQLDSVFTQSYPPHTVYIVGSTSNENSTEITNLISEKSQQYQKNEIIQYVSSSNNVNGYWFSELNQVISTDYVIVLNTNQVQPGKEYFNFVIRLLNTPHFENVFIGTEKQNYGCQQSTHYVNTIDDIWVFRYEWFSVISQLNNQLHPSLALYQSLEIPSVLIPTLKDYPSLAGNQNSDSICQQPDLNNGSILFYVKTPSAAFRELICQFNKKHQVIHLTSSSNTVSCTHENDNVIIYHSITKVKNEFNHLVNQVLPSVIIYEEDSRFMMDILSSSVKQTNDVTFIQLPFVEDSTTISWMADLPIESLEQWNKPIVKLIITTSGTKKLKDFQRVFNSIRKANYLGDEVDLSILMDVNSDASTSKYVNNIKWENGVKQIRHRISSVHPMQIFAESWYPSGNHEYAVLLDDRVELSPSFYIWIKQNLLKYRYSTTTNKQLFGISLYSPHIVDTDPSGRLLLQPNDDSTPYLMQAPCSSGALYFPEHWREFHDYITARLTDQAIVKRGSKNNHLFKDSLLTVARSNKWINSWRKYFDELVYMRGYVMLYPSFTTSYSTLHITTNNKKKQKMYKLVEKLYNIPLTNSVSQTLPDLDLLPILDLHGKATNQDELIERGHQLQQKFSACEPKVDHRHDPSDLLCPFSHLIQIPITDSPNSVPVLSVNVYN